MPDEPAATATEPAAKQEPEAKPPEPGKQEPETKDAPLGDAGEKALEAWKQRARDAEAKAKELAPLADKARELEEANKSELEKAQGKLTKAEQAQADAEAKLLRYEVAQEKEVPAKLVPLLTATSREDLETQADLIKENAKESAPKTDFDAGVRDTAEKPKNPEEAHRDFLMTVFGKPSDT